MIYARTNPSSLCDQGNFAAGNKAFRSHKDPALGRHIHVGPGGVTSTGKGSGDLVHGQVAYDLLDLNLAGVGHCQEPGPGIVGHIGLEGRSRPDAGLGVQFHPKAAHISGPVDRLDRTTLGINRGGTRGIDHGPLQQDVGSSLCGDYGHLSLIIPEKLDADIPVRPDGVRVNILDLFLFYHVAPVGILSVPAAVHPVVLLIHTQVRLAIAVLVHHIEAIAILHAKKRDNILIIIIPFFYITTAIGITQVQTVRFRTIRVIFVNISGCEKVIGPLFHKDGFCDVFTRPPVNIVRVLGQGVDTQPGTALEHSVPSFVLFLPHGKAVSPALLGAVGLRVRSGATPFLCGHGDTALGLLIEGRIGGVRCSLRLVLDEEYAGPALGGVQPVYHQVVWGLVLDLDVRVSAQDTYLSLACVQDVAREVDIPAAYSQLIHRDLLRGGIESYQEVT